MKINKYFYLLAFVAIATLFYLFFKIDYIGRNNIVFPGKNETLDQGGKSTDFSFTCERDSVSGLIISAVRNFNSKNYYVQPGQEKKVVRLNLSFTDELGNLRHEDWYYGIVDFPSGGESWPLHFTPITGCKNQKVSVEITALNSIDPDDHLVVYNNDNKDDKNNNTPRIIYRDTISSLASESWIIFWRDSGFAYFFLTLLALNLAAIFLVLRRKGGQ